MTTDHAELLSALMDREDVDPSSLEAALEDPEARRALVGFASVRRGLHQPSPGEHEWAAVQARRLASAPVLSRGEGRGGLWRLAAAAVLLLAGLAAGMAGERYRSRQGPPEPSRVVQLEPVSARP